MKLYGLVVLMWTGACLREDPPAVRAEPSSRPVMVAAANTLLGAPITLTTDTQLAALVRRPAQFAGQTVRTEGTVAAVCQARGCWMEIRDEAAQVHVRMHGHAFFMPRDSQGRHAIVQATVIAANPAGECEHEAEQQTGQPVASLELDATGVELRP